MIPATDPMLSISDVLITDTSLPLLMEPSVTHVICYSECSCAFARNRGRERRVREHALLVVNPTATTAILSEVPRFGVGLLQVDYSDYPNLRGTQPKDLSP
jgi:hypothetical protein